MEKNHPGFNSDIKDPEQPAYKAFVQKLEQQISNDPAGKYCIVYLKQYLWYLKDHHIDIQGRSTPVREDSAAAVAAFLQSPAYLSTESIATDSMQVVHYLSQLREPGIEGIYKTLDNSYTIAIIKNKNAARDYAGIILNSGTKLWTKGQVKIELRQVNDTLFDVFTYLRNHALDYSQARYRNGKLSIGGWMKVYPQPSQQEETIGTDLFTFKLLDSNTAYLAVTNFSGRFSTYLDSAYKAVMPEINRRRYLVIDIRNNGGGSDMNYKALMPLIYTDPIINDVVDYYATPGNIGAYEAILNDTKNHPEVYGKDGYKSWEYGVNKMKRAKPYSFTPMVGTAPTTTTYPINKGYPQKVAILHNRNTASAAESLLFEARFSKKAITVGEHSGGYTGYGNIMSVTTPCGNRLSWTTTRYRHQRQFDFTGIPPMYRVPATEPNWVEYARELVKRQ